MMQAATLRELGAEIKGTDFQFYEAGAYAAIFVDRNKGRARKVFFGEEIENLSLVQSVFDDEITAYAIAQSGPDTAPHTPKFHGVVGYCSIVARDGKFLDVHFKPRLVYEMEFIASPAVKLNQSQHFAVLAKKFKSAGINYLEDASIFEDNDPPLLIDFGTFDPNPKWDCGH